MRVSLELIVLRVIVSMTGLQDIAVRIRALRMKVEEESIMEAPPAATATSRRCTPQHVLPAMTVTRRGKMEAATINNACYLCNPETANFLNIWSISSGDWMRLFSSHH